MTTTFVTAYIDLNEDREKYRSHEENFKHFFKLASTPEITIIVFLSKIFIKDIELGLSKLDVKGNIIIIPFELEDTWTYGVSKKNKLTLPRNRNTYKDTENFLILMNAKMDFLDIVSERYPQYKYLYWVDFCIFHVIKDVELAHKKLRFLSTCCIEKGLYAPGCWKQGMYNFSIEILLSQINWTWCGGFLGGDRESLKKSYSIYKQVFNEIIEKYHSITWEVNVWVLMSYTIEFTQYIADHNDTILPNVDFCTIKSVTS